ncbi:MAG: hypothetical protein LBD14_03335 [Puniceicoccales bacterium]|jgi:hypothetical protein|nr:hypothetical protein [Puniceicoccales bacterium]
MRRQTSIKAAALNVASANLKLHGEDYFPDAHEQHRLTRFEKKKYRLLKFSIFSFVLVLLVFFIAAEMKSSINFHMEYIFIFQCFLTWFLITYIPRPRCGSCGGRMKKQWIACEEISKFHCASGECLFLYAKEIKNMSVLISCANENSQCLDVSISLARSGLLRLVQAFFDVCAESKFGAVPAMLLQK